MDADGRRWTQMDADKIQDARFPIMEQSHYYFRQIQNKLIRLLEQFVFAKRRDHETQ